MREQGKQRERCEGGGEGKSGRGRETEREREKSASLNSWLTSNQHKTLPLGVSFRGDRVLVRTTAFSLSPTVGVLDPLPTL